MTNPAYQLNGQVPNSNIKNPAANGKNITGTWPKRPPMRINFNDRLNGPVTKSMGYLNK
jgi:hypothetical protein